MSPIRHGRASQSVLRRHRDVLMEVAIVLSTLLFVALMGALGLLLLRVSGGG